MNSWPFQNHETPAQHIHVPVQPGVHTRLTVNSTGFSTGAPVAGPTFNHPFRPALGANSLTFNLGTVASLAGDGPLEPKITVNGERIRMSGKNGSSPVPLKLSADIANSEGVSWAALEASPDDKGELTKDSKIEIVHTAEGASHDEKLGRCHIAMILWKARNPFRVLPLVHFNLRYIRLVSPGGGAPRHLFL
jgi:hypothetical protein